MWAGLGYYSRARNLHKAATQLAKAPFPKSYIDLLEYPGFGPYTARSVASLAFDESVGVLDGNVIRVLTRVNNLGTEWWKTAVRNLLQTLADEWVQNRSSAEMNQALMELGATICLPQNPACLICPIHDDCESRKKGTVHLRPLKRPRRERELWVWEPSIIEKRGRILICRSTSTPFLKNQWLLPGTAKRVKKTPKRFHFRHSITHHDIFVTIQNSSAKLLNTPDQKWVLPSELSRHVPASLVQKALAIHRRN